MSRKKSPQLGIFFKIGDRIKQIRLMSGVNQETFGKIFGVKGNTVSRWEKGRLSDEETLKKIADYGGVDLDWLLRGDAAAGLRVCEAPPKPLAPSLDPAALAEIILRLRDFANRRRLTFDLHTEAALLSLLYDLWQNRQRFPEEEDIDACLARARNLIQGG